MPAMVKFLAVMLMYSFIFPKAYVAVIPRSVLWLKKHFYDEVPADVKWAVTYQSSCWGCCLYLRCSFNLPGLHGLHIRSSNTRRNRSCMDGLIWGWASSVERERLAILPEKKKR